MRKYLIYSVVTLFLTSTQAQVPNLFIYDKNQSSLFGAANLVSLHKLSYEKLGKIIPNKLWDETKWINRLGGIGYRALKLGVTGFQVDVNTFAKFYGGGFKILNLINSDRLKANTSIDFWNQPEFHIGTSSGVKKTDQGFGFMAKGSVYYFPMPKNKNIGINSEVGFKTDGYLMGEMLSSGFIFRFGLSWFILNEHSTDP